MAGIAGIVELAGAPAACGPLLHAMADEPSEARADFLAPGVGLTTAHPAGPGTSANETVVAVCGGGEAARLVRLWEKHGPGMLDRLRGPFAFAIWDARRRQLFLARDRFGIAALFWARRGDWFVFASDVRALFASGLVRAAPDHAGIDHVFTFLGLPTDRTCFEGVHALRPGHSLLVRVGHGSAAVEERRYWDVDYPDRGQEDDGPTAALADRLESALLAAVGRRAPAGEALASFVSGGIDCGTLLALAGKSRGAPLPSFTIRLRSPGDDESDAALRVARAGGSEAVVVPCGAADMVENLQRVIRAAEYPVPDPSSAALLLLAERTRAAGHRAALSGDGADDLFAGYPWFRANRLLTLLDWLPGLRPSQALRRLYLRLTAPPAARSNLDRIHALVGGHHAWLDVWGLIALSKFRFYGPAMRDALGGRLPYEDLDLDLDRMRRWHPLNRGLYLGMKVHLPGLQLHAKGARVAAAAGLEVRHPFLDEEVVALACRLHPRWKLRRLRDKYLLRHIARRWLPRDVAWRPKRDFFAPFDTLFAADAPPFVDELLSEESIRRAGYFDAAAVRHWRENYGALRRRSGARLSTEAGLAAVVATQLWHHTFLDGTLSSVPSRASTFRERRAEVAASTVS
jgi:asparagine synthase (glutamine-hydrolysing)